MQKPATASVRYIVCIAVLLGRRDGAPDRAAARAGGAPLGAPTPVR